MGYKKLLPAIVALLLATATISTLTTSVSATHTPTVNINGESAITVKPDTGMVLTITVQNATGSDPIENVRVILDSEFTKLAPTVKVPKDNTVQLAATDNENVVLAAGTKVKLTGATTVTIPENTGLIRLAGDNVFYENQAGTDSENLRLVDNVRIKKNATVNATGLTTNDNVITVAQTTVSLDENDVVTLAETVVVRVTGNIVRLPENTWVKVHDDTNCRTVAADNMTTEKEKTVVLDNGSNWVTDNAVSIVVIKTGLGGTLPAGAWVSLRLAAGENDENRVVLPAGSRVILGAATTVALSENENVLRVAPGATENIYLIDPISAENQPINWEQRTGTSIAPEPAGPYVEWKGIGENRIAGGGSLSFPFAVTTPSGTPHTVYVRTTDNAGRTEQRTVTITVDNVSPTVTVTASPSWVKDNTVVTITVRASEPLAKLDNVMVAENNATENTQVKMSSTDGGITWTGTYTTVDNKLRDGTARVGVVGAQFEDLVGNKGSYTENTFTVDRMAPPAPSLSALTGFPAHAAGKAGTNISSWLVEGTAQDNFLGVLVVQENMRVKIRVGTTVQEKITDASGYFFTDPAIRLSPGTQEVGIRYSDRAGNVGPENAENITFDNTAPSIAPGTIAGKTLADNVRINDNTPTITLTITETVLGLENLPFNAAENRGYSVQLQYENGDPIDNLVNSLAFDNLELDFENTIPATIGSFTAGLPDGTYRIYVVAGDNLQMDNKVITFVVDTTAPLPPTLTATASSNPAAPDLKMTTSVALGGTCEAGATVKVWTSPEPFTVETVATSVVDTGGTGIWSAVITISQGVTTKISVSQVDIAGNEGSKRLYGYLMVDASAPTVVITLPATGTKTDKASITVSGTVTKDTWEIWSDITLRVQVGLTGTTVPISAGTFSVDVALAEGSNTIIATATDPRGWSSSAIVTVERTVTPWGTYAIILVIVALILAAIAIFRKR